MTYEYLPDNQGVYLNRRPEYDINYLITKQSTNYVIAIDGLAGSGKSTLGKQLSQLLNIPHVSSGIFYRVFTYIFVVNNVEFTQDNIDNIADDISFQVHKNELSILYKDNKVPMSELKNDAIDAALNRYSTNIYFRESVSRLLVKMVQSLNQSFIIDLRGAYPTYIQELEKQNRSVIRLLLVAQTSIKAQRRVTEYLESKYSKDQYYRSQEHQAELFQSILQKIIERDQGDIQSIIKTNIGLIHPQSGVIDTSEITQHQVVELALNYTQKCLLDKDKVHDQEYRLDKR
jgi:CMP/dCMP kinase